MFPTLRTISIIRKGLQESSNLKIGMSRWQSKCDAKSLSQPIDPAACPAKCLMDEAPKPCGDWKENYNRRNARYNQIMVGGIVIFLFSCFMVKREGLIRGYPYSGLF